MATIRTLTITAAALAGTILLAGCSRDDGPDPGGTESIRFTASTTGDVTPLLNPGLSQYTGTGLPITTATGNGSPSTRTTEGGNQWLTSDEVGIFMFSSGQGIPAGVVVGYENRKFKPVTGNSPTSDLVPTDGTTVYWPQTGSYDFAAYYPYGEKGNGTGKVDGQYNLKISVADQSDPEAIDVLYAKTTGKSKGEQVDFAFGHVLAKVRVNIKAGDAIDPGDLANMTATLLGIPTTAKLSLSDGMLSAEADADNVSMTGKTPETGIDAAFEAIVLPAAAGGQQVKFTFTGMIPLYWAVPDTHDLPAGKTRVYELTVSAKGVELDGSSIVPWTANDNGTGEMVELVVQPDANSYMVAPGSAPILIPVSQANRVLTADGLNAATTDLGGVEAGNFTVELIWGDSPVGAGGVVEEIEAYGEYVYVKPGPTEGNMVIAIRDKGTSKIKWSWHIWVTEPVKSGTDGVTGVTWMDRNLGAKSNTPYLADGSYDDDQWVKTLGLFYQWGRKDAFPGSDGGNNNQTYYTKDEIAGTTDDIPTDDHTELFTMVQNPLSFARNGNTYHGSIDQGYFNNSWGGVTGKKTLYDPCPPGWKVPPKSINNQNVWGSNSVSDWPNEWNKGRIFDGVSGTANLGHFYPAAGGRNLTSGSFNGVTTTGWWWSGSQSADNASYSDYLGIYSSSVSPGDKVYRSSGFSVRCVAE